MHVGRASWPGDLVTHHVPRLFHSLLLIRYTNDVIQRCMKLGLRDLVFGHVPRPSVRHAPSIDVDGC